MCLPHCVIYEAPSNHTLLFFMYVFFVCFLVLMQMNELYQHCMNQCRVTHEKLGANCKTPLTPQMVVNTADKLIYNYAVEQVLISFTLRQIPFCL